MARIPSIANNKIDTDRKQGKLQFEDRPGSQTPNWYRFQKFEFLRYQTFHPM